MAWDDELRRQEAALRELLKDQQRVEGIVDLCWVDTILERLLRAVMIDDKAVDKLMRDGQALQSFSIKVKVVYALGLIPKGVRKDLDCLNKIRNEFAHNVEADSFDKTQIRDLCQNLSTAKALNGDSLDPIEVYRLASVKCSLFLASVATRKERVKAEGQKQQLDLLQSEYEKISQQLAPQTK